jgi:cell division protein FtsQ
MNRIRWQPLRRQLIEWSSLGFLVLITVGPVVMLLWLLLFTQTFAVSAITIVDARPQTEEKIRSVADSLKGKNILFLETSVLAQRMLRDIPQIKNVHIVRKIPGTVKIIIQEKTPVLLLVSGGSYYFVDSAGIAYEAASLDSLPGVVLPTVKNSDLESTVTLGAPAVDESFVTFIEEVQKKIPDIAHAQVVEMNIPSLAAREVHFLLDRNWRILMDTTRPASGQLDVLKRLLEHTVSQEEQQTLQYIDLRIANRVYYKTKGLTQ